MDFVDRRIVPTCDFAATALPGMTSELCGWVGEGDGDGDGDGVVNVLALIRPVDVAKRGMVNELHNPEVVRARHIGKLAAMAMAQYLLLDKQAKADMTFDTKTLQKTMNKHKKRGDVAILLP